MEGESMRSTVLSTSEESTSDGPEVFGGEGKTLLLLWSRKGRLR